MGAVMEANSFMPTRGRERITELDTLRGIALFGVLVVNIFYFSVPASYFDSYFAKFHDPINVAVLRMMFWFLEGKFYPIFSLMFGVGLSIQFSKSVESGGKPYAFLARRLIVLLLFGLVHIVFVWEEDILFIYALFGLMVLAMMERPPKLILMMAVILYLASPIFNILNFYFHFMPVPSGAPEPFGYYVNFYTTASYWQILQQRILFYIHKFSRVDVVFSELDRLAYILFGYYVERMGIVYSITQRPRNWVKVFTVLLLVFLTAFLVDKIWLRDLDLLGNPPALLTLQEISITVSDLFLVFSYIIGILLLLKNVRMRKLFLPLSSIGRTAFTAYLVHTVFYSFLFYSFGLKLYGSLSPVWLFAISIMVYTIEAWLSVLWLKKIIYGPFEWIWRSLTYKTILPLVRR